MTEIPITYQDLFTLLMSFGFAPQPGMATGNRHVFCHAPTDTILVYGRQAGELVTSADMLSTDVHLHARGISEEPLESLLGAAVQGK